MKTTLLSVIVDRLCVISFCLVLNLSVSQQQVFADEEVNSVLSQQTELSFQNNNFQLGFIFIEQLDDVEFLQARITGAADAGYQSVVVVSPANQPSIRFRDLLSELASSEIIILEAIEIPMGTDESQDSLIVVCPPGKTTEFSTDEEFPRTGIEKSFESIANWLSAEFPKDANQPLLIFNPQTWVGETSFEIVQQMRRIEKLEYPLMGFPVIAFPGNTTSATQFNFQTQVRENAWDQLLGVHNFKVNSAFALSSIPFALSDNQPAFYTWIQAEEFNPAAIFAALGTGHFFVEASGLVKDLNLRVEATGLDQPLHAGDNVTLAAGSKLHVRLRCYIPDKNRLDQPNHLDMVEIVVTENSEVENLTQSGIFVDQVDQSWDLIVPPDGCSIRGCVFRNYQGQLESVAFTNPIQIETFPVESSVTIVEVLPLTTIGGVVVFFLAVIALIMVRKYLGRRLPTISENVFVGRSIEKPISQPKTEQIQSHQAREVDWSPPDPKPRALDYFVTEKDILSRRHFLAAAILMTLLVVYGLFVPLRYRPIGFSDAIEQFSKVPYLNIGLYGRQDWVANLLLFIPLGVSYCGSMMLDRERKFLFRILAFIVTSVALTGLAIGTEFFQQWFPPRTVSQNDIIAETLGGMIGSLIAVLFLQKLVDWTRELIQKSSLEAIVSWGLSVYLGLLLFATLMPFDFVLSLNELQQKYHQGRIDFAILPQSRKEFVSLFVVTIVNIPVGLWAIQLKKTHLRFRSNGVFFITYFIPILFELLQVPVFSRRTAIQNVMAGILGVSLGITLLKLFSASITRYFSERPAQHTRRAFVTILISLFYTVVVFYLYKGEISRETDGETMNRLHNFWQIPFARLYWGTELNAFFVIVRQILLFVPVGFLFADAVIYVGKNENLKYRMLFSLLLISVFATLFEIAQAWSTNHLSDVTDSMMLTTGGFLGLIIRFLILDLINLDILPVKKRTISVGRAAFFLLAAYLGMLTTGYASLHVIYEANKKILQPDKRIQLVIDGVATSQNIKVENILVPTPEYNEAIWGSTGVDHRGDLWIGVSDGRTEHASARMLKLEPSQGRLVEVSDVLTELKKHNLAVPAVSQSKIHSKFIEASDGWVYFTSMDEQGEKSDGSQLPTWGSHLWKIDPESYETEHLAAVPEGLIAIGGGGDWIYSLGLFDHVLYQWNVQTREMKRKVVGAIGGHISRNFVTDLRGHAFVPRLRRYGDQSESLKKTLVKDESVIVELVEFDTNLIEVSSFPLRDYLTQSYWSSHGITGICQFPNGNNYFTTSAGRLYRILSPLDRGASRVQDLGWFHPNGSSYAPSLFYMGENLIGGIVSINRNYQWVERDLKKLKSHAEDFPFPEKIKDSDGLLLYGSQSKDQFGGAYIVGRQHGTPLLMRISHSRMK